MSRHRSHATIEDMKPFLLLPALCAATVVVGSAHARPGEAPANLGSATAIGAQPAPGVYRAPDDTGRRMMIIAGMGAAAMVTIGALRGGSDSTPSAPPSQPPGDPPPVEPPPPPPPPTPPLTHSSGG